MSSRRIYLENAAALIRALREGRRLERIYINF